MNRTDRFDFTLDEETEKRLYDLLTDMDTRNTNRFCIKDKRGYHAEYVKARHGKWIPWKYHNGFRCEFCNEPVDNKHNYCPNCGARMDAERREE